MKPDKGFRAGEGAAGTFLLWYLVLGPPGIWAARLSVSYVIVPYVCSTGRMWALHLVSALAASVILLTAITAFRIWRREVAAARPGAAPERRKFMALVGLLSAALFLLVVIAEALANFFISPCQQAGFPIA